MDDGSIGSFTEVAESVRNMPGLHELEISFDESDLGKQFRIKIAAFNIEGSTFSDIATITLGDIPSAPLTAIRKI